ncbi:aldo/keto reductase [Spirillospora sp. CA-108201]
MGRQRSATAIRTIREHALAAGSPGPQLAQLKYSPCRRSIPDGEPFAAVFAEGVALQASDVLEGGMLAGNARPSRRIGRDPGDIRSRVREAAEGIAELGAGLDATPAQLCIAFTLTRPSTATVLFGASGMRQLTDDIAALDVLERVGAQRPRSLMEPFWADRGVVDPEGP